MPVEGLFMGLLMICLQPDCPAIVSEDAQARVMLINATETRCGEQCSLCGGRTVSTHRPRLYLRCSDLGGISGITLLPCDDQRRCGGKLVYWDLTVENVCFSGLDHRALEQKGTRSIGTEKPNGVPEYTFDWIPSVTRFDRNFVLRTDLEPRLRGPVVARVDLDGGKLRAALVGRDYPGTGYSTWRASPDIWAERRDFPRALAEAFIWKSPPLGGDLRIEDCNDPSRYLILKNGSRFIVSNLPPSCKGTVTGLGPELVHFRAYFGLSNGDNCAAPLLNSGSSMARLSGLEFHTWIENNVLRRHSCPPPGVGNALCPPTKYP